MKKINKESPEIQEKVYGGILAGVLLSAEEESIENLSEKLIELQKNGIDISPVKVRRVAGGYYSEDLDRMISSFVITGVAKQRSPFTLIGKGRERCKHYFLEAKKVDKARMEQVSKVLGITF